MREKIRKILVACGLVRVDGLSYFQIGNHEMQLVESNPGAFYRHSFNNGKGAIATPEGEVWLGCYPAVEKAVEALRVEGVYSTNGCFIPFSNGERENLGEILHRMFDPDSNL